MFIAGGNECVCVWGGGTYVLVRMQYVCFCEREGVRGDIGVYVFTLSVCVLCLSDCLFLNPCVCFLYVVCVCVCLSV